MKNPSACRPPIAPYMAMTLARSGRVIAPNDCRASRPMRGDASAVEADTGPSLRGSPGVGAVYLRSCRYVVPAGQMDLDGVVDWPEPACSCLACCCQARCAVTVTSLRRECGSASGPDGPALRGQRCPELADAVSA